MELRAAVRAAAAVGALSLIAACGGGSVDGASAGAPSQPGISGGGSTQSPPTRDSVGSGSPTQSQPAANANFGGSTTLKYVTIDLNCSACTTAGGSGIGDGEQVGSARMVGPDGYAANHNVMWRGSASSIVDLGQIAEAGAVLATSGGIQVGWHGTDVYDHAAKWVDGVVENIHPPTLRESKAFGVTGDQIVGYGLSEWWMPGGYYIHALLWTSAGVMDLNPAGYGGSVALGTDGRLQVGYGDRLGALGFDVACCRNHALLWSGSAESAIDLHPASGYDTTSANAVSGGQQVGWGDVSAATTNTASRHALLWMGTAGSVVDLHPSGLRDSTALGVAQGRQVGWGTSTDGTTHALLWNGTAASVVDLHLFLSPGFTWSRANGIDAAGNIIGSATDANGITHAILWVPQ